MVSPSSADAAIQAESATAYAVINSTDDLSALFERPIKVAATTHSS
jgi:hypothetical protein